MLYAQEGVCIGSAEVGVDHHHIDVFARQVQAQTGRHKGLAGSPFSDPNRPDILVGSAPGRTIL